MTQLLFYSIKVAFCLTLLCGVTALSLRGITQFRFRRLVVMSAVILSLVLPLLTLCDWKVTTSYTNNWMSNAVTEAMIYEPWNPEAEGASFIKLVAGHLAIVGWVYIAGVVTVAVYYAGGMMRLRQVINRGVRYDEDDGHILVIENENLAPFSWAGKIVLSVDDIDNESLSDIITHEETHVKFLHWVDMMVMCAVCALTWYFPTAWLIKRHLQDLHEYEADNEVIAGGTDVNDYSLMLIRKIAGRRCGALASSINQSSLKKRFIMMTKHRMRGIVRFRALALVPAIAIAVAVMAMPEMASAFQTVATPPEKLVVYDKPEVDPEYPGGLPALMNFLSRNTEYPKEAEKKESKVGWLWNSLLQPPGMLPM